MLRLAQAASSEYHSKYGTPPNQLRTKGQLDGELNIIDFYGGWKYVFRPKNEKVAERIAYLMEGAVMNGDYIGYGQESLKSDGGKYPRTGVFDALFDMANPDTRLIKKLCNCDCSSLVGACVYGAAHYAPALYKPELRTMWTGTERSLLMKTGEFIELTDPQLLQIGTGLKRGDILLMDGHTAVAVDSDAHRDTFPVIIDNCSKSRIRTGPGTEYDTIKVVAKGEIYDAEGTALDTGGFPWYRVHTGVLVGYTSSAYASPLPAGNCKSDTWLRKGAGTSKAKVIVIPKGAKPYLTGRQTRVGLRVWYEVIYGGHKGWASSLNVKK